MSSDIRIVSPSGDVSHASEGLSLTRLRTIIQDSHINILLGAGSSAPFFGQLGDVENVLTQVRPTDSEKVLIRTSVQAYFFEKVLRPNQTLLDGEEHGARVLIGSYSRFIATLNRILLKRRSSLLGKQANIFTTNVDMALELAMENLEVDCNDGFSGKIRPRLDLGSFNTLRLRQGTRYGYQSEIPTMNLFKIHGSVGWHQIGPDIFFDHRLEQIEKLRKSFRLGKSELIPIASPGDIDVTKLASAAAGKELGTKSRAFAKMYKKLSIVNPEKTKFESTVLNKTYYELLRRFANELEKENSVLLVHGFSFRDEHMLDLVLRAAATNPTLQVIVFCYDQDSYAAIEPFFPAEKLKNGNIALVKPKIPEDGGKERKLTLDALVADYFAAMLEEQLPKADHTIELVVDEGERGGDDA